MAMEYSSDGATKVELKSDLAPGLYETRDGKLYLVENDTKSAFDAAADRFERALRQLMHG
ncbi:hypothetical protein QA649_34495 [Bradyrhizobium sp. CB1717]|uniref:hypothetical protein n=1 Tax=Bradyrhizobium sp. CB1717 TaxID=3039154 RepID=UPI0024B26107|nr:hypothetical protein [Bradyrhizobium sp. CB1717]WFU23153.1 hypothetical protein QA649_34495 [Bradyrhizobium sp. CB1717]